MTPYQQQVLEDLYRTTRKGPVGIDTLAQVNRRQSHRVHAALSWLMQQRLVIMERCDTYSNDGAILETSTYVYRPTKLGIAWLHGHVPSIAKEHFEQLHDLGSDRYGVEWLALHSQLTTIARQLAIDVSQPLMRVLLTEIALMVCQRYYETPSTES